MGKILKFLIIFFLIFGSSYGADKYDEQFKKFDLNYKKLNRSDMLKYHHVLKNIYIQSAIKNDLNLKIKTLKRLIISSSRLNLNSKSYKKELSTLQKIVNKNKLKSSKKTSKTSKKRSSKNIPKLLKIQTSSKGISLIFDRNVENLDVRVFVLKGKKYKYVYSLNGILIGKARKFKIKNIDQIHIAQYNKEVVRIVFTDRKKMKFYYSKVGNSINIGEKGLRAKKTTKAKSSKKISKTKKTKSKKTTKKPKYTKPTINSKVIVIDAGHGGKDGGAQGKNGLSEKKVVLKVALKLGRELQSRGFKVYYTRIRDKFIGLRNRTKMANRKKADLFVSIHANAAPNRSKYKSMRGVETFFLSPARSKRSKRVAALENKSDVDEMDYFSKQTFLNFLNREKIIASNKLALDIQQSMLNSLRKKYKVKDGGVREAPFWILVGAQMPAVLVEIGYITNPIEGKRMLTKTYQNLLAKGISNGIQSYFAKNH
ncbi:MAG: N-acetylmuramoyl-L-alanine amidase [Proteobacteria bacterium]|nr:MAG: N-acetylmuramoyl-L-alanine amidase [Pseudomonadota bacterium]